MEHLFLRFGDYTVSREAIAACWPGQSEGNGKEQIANLRLEYGDGTMNVIGIRGVAATQLLTYWRNPSQFPVNAGVVEISNSCQLTAGSTFHSGRTQTAAA